MKIGIDISQVAFKGTGVGNYLACLVEALVAMDSKNEYILFYSSMRRELDKNFETNVKRSNVKIKKFRFPPLLLDLLWNRLHILPVEALIGGVDVFISSDWSEPPVIGCKKATIIYDFIVFKYPQESHNMIAFNRKAMRYSPNIVATQKRKLAWSKRECSIIFCISEATRKDAMEILGIASDRLKVIYPGFTI